MFWMYNLDIHNLDVEGLADCMSDPRSEHRWSQVKISPVDFKNLPNKQDVDSLSEELAVMNVKPTEVMISCEVCNLPFTSEGYLKRHQRDKHGLENKKFECPICSKILSTKQKMESLIQTQHLKCKVKGCSEEFITNNERMIHQQTHTTCSICGENCKTKAKLDNHSKKHKEELRLQHLWLRGYK